MGGKVLEYEAKTIRNEGIEKGREEGIEKGREEGIEKGRGNKRNSFHIKEIGNSASDYFAQNPGAV